MPESIWDSDPEMRARAEVERKEHREAKPNGHAGSWREPEIIKFRDMPPRLDGRPLIKGLLEREQASVCFGDSGCGKTFLCLALALRVAAGIDCFDRKVHQGAVIYVATEAGRSIINRVAAFKIARHLEDDDIPFFAVPSPVDLCHADVGDIERLIGTIRDAVTDSDVALIVIDTVSRALAGGNENAPDDKGSFVRSLDRLRDEFHCHVCAVHHSGKNYALGARGHSLLKAAVDTEIEVTRNDNTKISTATITKQRDGISEDQIAFRLRQIELGEDQDEGMVTSCIVEQSDDLPRKAHVKRALPARRQNRA